MPKPIHIVAVTGGRADWGPLGPLLLAIKADPGFRLSLIVTGEHLVGEQTSLAEIREDGFDIAQTIDIQIGDDSPAAVARSTGLAVTGVGRAITDLSPDLVIVLGDRYEILAAVIAALVHRIPVAHLCGGDLTEGAMDDSIRHAITKLSHIHFVTNAEALARVLQLGESPVNVHLVGSPGLDRIRSTPIMDRAALFASLGLRPRRYLVLVTYHPVTLADDPLSEAREMLAALDLLGTDYALVFTGSNADPGARGIDGLIASFVERHDNAVAHRTLGSKRYLSALAHADVVVGNSSSGLYEAPSFCTPTVNIGDRQKSRVRAASVVDVSGERGAIFSAIISVMERGFAGIENPYGDGRTSERIIATLKTIGEPRSLLRKRFHQLQDPKMP